MTWKSPTLAVTRASAWSWLAISVATAPVVGLNVVLRRPTRKTVTTSVGFPTICGPNSGRPPLACDGHASTKICSHASGRSSGCSASTGYVVNGDRHSANAIEKPSSRGRRIAVLPYARWPRGLYERGLGCRPSGFRGLPSPTSRFEAPSRRAMRLLPCHSESGRRRDRVQVPRRRARARRAVRRGERAFHRTRRPSHGSITRRDTPQRLLVGDPPRRALHHEIETGQAHRHHAPRITREVPALACARSAHEVDPVVDPKRTDSRAMRPPTRRDCRQPVREMCRASARCSELLPCARPGERLVAVDVEALLLDARPTSHSSRGAP